MVIARMWGVDGQRKILRGKEITERRRHGVN